MKIKFNSDDKLPINKALKFHNMNITIRSIFEEELNPQLFLDDTLYELKMRENTDLTYYQRNKDLILNKKKNTIKATRRD